jgi:hypothetical protein
MLQADFEAIVVMGMDKTSFAIWANIENLVEFTFHQFKISKAALGFLTSSTKYRSISDLFSNSLLEARNL